MRANDLVQEVERAQRDLRSEIAGIVEDSINAVSAKTGLVITGVDVRLSESTGIDSRAREWRVDYVSILYELPNMVSMEYP